MDKMNETRYVSYVNLQNKKANKKKLFLESINQRVFSIQGDNYSKYIYPIEKDLEIINSIEFLYNKLQSISRDKINYELFCDLINRMVNCGVLKSYTKEEVMYKNDYEHNKINIKKNILVIDTTESLYVSKLCNVLTSTMNLSVELLLVYNNLFEDIVKSKINTDNLNNIVYIHKQDNLENLMERIQSKPDVVVLVQKQYINEITEYVQKFCTENNIQFLNSSYNGNGGVVGPFYLNCKTCSINDVKKSYESLQFLYKYNNIINCGLNSNPATVLTVYSLIINELFNHFCCNSYVTNAMTIDTLIEYDYSIHSIGKYKLIKY